MGDLERLVNDTIDYCRDHSGVAVSIREITARHFTLSIAPLVGGMAGDFVEIPEYRSSTLEEIYGKIAAWGLCEVIGPEREEFVRLADERVRRSMIVEKEERKQRRRASLIERKEEIRRLKRGKA